MSKEAQNVLAIAGAALAALGLIIAMELSSPGTRGGGERPDRVGETAAPGLIEYQ